MHAHGVQCVCIFQASWAEATDEEPLEGSALEMVFEETFHEAGRRWRPWAPNGKSVRIGSIILLIDADIRIPQVNYHQLYRQIALQACFRNAACEFAESSEIAIIQHESEAIGVAGCYYEKGLTELTHRFYHGGCSKWRCPTLLQAQCIPLLVSPSSIRLH